MGRQPQAANIKTSKVLGRVNPDNYKLEDEWLTSCKMRGCADSTVYTYQNIIETFWCWNQIYNSNLYWPIIKRHDFKCFFDYGYTALNWGTDRVKTAAKVLDNLGYYFEEFYKDVYPNYVNNVPFKYAKNVAREHTDYTKVTKEYTFTQKKAYQILQVLKRRKQTVVAGFFALSLAGGMMPSEIAQLKVSDLDEEHFVHNLIAVENIKTDSPLCFNDAYKTFYIYWPYCEKYVNAWLEERKEKVEEGNEWLFPHYDSKQKKYVNEPMTKHEFTTFKACLDNSDYRAHFEWSLSQDVYKRIIWKAQDIPYEIACRLAGQKNLDIEPEEEIEFVSRVVKKPEELDIDISED